MINQPESKATIKVAKWGFIILGVTWLVLGVYSLLRIMGGSTSLASFGWIIASLMFVNGFILLWIGWGLKEAGKFYFFLALLTLAGNILLTITDEFGFLDLLTLIIAIGLVLLLIFTRSNYLSAG
jgi:hypothetical protein